MAMPLKEVHLLTPEQKKEMMNLNNFKKKVPLAIFERGQGYFFDGAVKDLQIMDNGQCFAIVEGSEDYEVDITLGKDNEITRYNCNCPYDGNLCKHVVAALLEIESENSNRQKGKKPKHNTDWRELANLVPEDKLRAFVLEYATGNKAFRSQLMLQFSDYDKTESPVKYRKMVAEAFHAASGWHGYIDYANTHAAMSPVYDLLGKAGQYLENGNLHEAFYIAAAVAPECINAIPDMDDSNGECGGAIAEAFGIMDRILEATEDKNLRATVIDWLRQEMDNPDYDNYGCGDELEPLFFAAAESAEEIKEAHKLADKLLEEASLTEGWSKEYRTKKYLQYKARLFQKEGKNNEAEKIVDDNLHISDFREIRVNEHLAAGNFEEAVRLIKEGAKIAADGKYAGTEQMWKVKLLEIYERLGHVEDIRKTAEGLFFGHNHEIRFYRKLKETFPYAEWSTERENIIKKLIQEKKGQAQVKWYFNQSLAEIYIEEELWDRLFGLVQQNPQIHILTGYGKYLNENYSDELTGFYQTAISAFADANTGRPAYQKLVQYLNEMARLKQGQAAVQKLKSELLARYKNRPAMKEELDKL